MNKVQLYGRLTKDIELKTTQSGMQYARFTLAVNKPYKKDQEQDADFISCVAWDKRAEHLYRFYKKGSALLLDGRIQTGSYDDRQTGKKVYTTDIVVENTYFTEKKSNTNNYTPVEIIDTTEPMIDDSITIEIDPEMDLPF